MREMSIPARHMIRAISRSAVGLMAFAKAVVGRFFVFVTAIRALPNLLKVGVVLTPRAGLCADDNLFRMMSETLSITWRCYISEILSQKPPF